MENMVGRRSALLTVEQQLEGQTLVSLETQDDFAQDDILIYLSEHFPDWLSVLRLLSKEQQEMLLSYYLLSKTQSTLAKLLGATQTVVSFRIRMSVRLIGALLMWGGAPSVKIMKPLLVKSGHQDLLVKIGLAEAIWEYDRCRSFKRHGSAGNVSREKFSNN